MEQHNKEYFDEINIARGMGMLIVLLGHSFPDAEIGTFAHPLYQWLYETCSSFHMALFFLISGFVMGRKFYAGEYVLGKEIIKKVKRLLVPYLFLSYLSLLPKIILNAYARNPVDASGAVKVLFGHSPNGSLWYVYTLFLFSVFVLFWGKFFGNTSALLKGVYLMLGGILGYALYLYAGETALQVLFFDKICRYLLFYVLGILIYRNYGKVRKSFHSVVAIVALGLVFLFTCPYIAVKIDYAVTALLGSYGVFVIADRITLRKKGRIYSFLDRCGDFSYDIYILSYYVQQAIRVICFRRLKWNYTIVFFVELLLGFGVSYLFSKCVLRKSRFLKCAVIGVWEK